MHACTHTCIHAHAHQRMYMRTCIHKASQNSNKRMHAHTHACTHHLMVHTHDMPTHIMHAHMPVHSIPQYKSDNNNNNTFICTYMCKCIPSLVAAASNAVGSKGGAREGRWRATARDRRSFRREEERSEGRNIRWKKGRRESVKNQ